MDLTIRTKLSIMMFLQYFAWGAWFVSMSGYISGTLGFSDGQKGLIYAASPIGAMVAPFFVGMIADRFFATQRILAALHLIGGAVLVGISMSQTYQAFFPLMLLFFLCYMPTMALTNSLAFSHMSDPGRQFPGIRVLGTIGWIVAGQWVGYMNIGDTNTPLQIGAAASVVLAVFCLTLPHTPPSNPGGRVEVRTVLGLDSLRLMKQWSFAVFVVGSFLICIPLQFYYSFAQSFLEDVHVENAVGKMTYGQMSEIFFMLVMPFFFVRLGVKYMLLVGMAAWASRYLLFSLGNADEDIWMLYMGILLHGICYDFFFVTGYIYVDKKAPEAIRASAQVFITFVTWGVGGFIGSTLAGMTGEYFRTGPKTHDWYGFWLTPAIAAVIVLVAFAFLFHDRVDAESDPRPM
ncbi:MAG: nucleoside permease [Planctomycetia bacterium]|nr:nucleoside permease [Planctomycetia bacterium]